MMRGFSQWALRHFALHIFAHFPLTRGYRAKTRLLRLAGMRVAADARVVSSARFFIRDVEVGRDTFIGHEFRCYGGVSSKLRIGDNVDIGPQSVVLAGSHRIGSSLRRAGRGTAGLVTIGDGVWVGGRCVIVAPATIHAGSVIAAGAVVRGVVPPNVVYFNSSDIRALAPEIAGGAREQP